MRWRNLGLWSAILAFLPLLAESLEVYNFQFVLPGNYEKVATAFLGILVLAGLLNNPTTDNKGFGDDKK